MATTTPAAELEQLTVKEETLEMIAARIAGFSLVAYHNNPDAVRAQIKADILSALRNERETCQWQPIETAPRREEWCVVGKFGDGKLLWWYRAMFWRNGWHTTRSYDARIKPSHWIRLPEALPCIRGTSPRS